MRPPGGVKCATRVSINNSFEFEYAGATEREAQAALLETADGTQYGAAFFALNQLGEQNGNTKNVA